MTVLVTGNTAPPLPSPSNRALPSISSDEGSTSGIVFETGIIAVCRDHGFGSEEFPQEDKKGVGV